MSRARRRVYQKNRDPSQKRKFRTRKRTSAIFFLESSDKSGNGLSFSQQGEGFFPGMSRAPMFREPEARHKRTKSRRARTLHGTKSTGLVVSGHVAFQAGRIIHTCLVTLGTLCSYVILHTHHSHVAVWNYLYYYIVFCFISHRILL